MGRYQGKYRELPTLTVEQQAQLNAGSEHELSDRLARAQASTAKVPENVGMLVKWRELQRVHVHADGFIDPEIILQTDFARELLLRERLTERVEWLLHEELDVFIKAGAASNRESFVEFIHMIDHWMEMSLRWERLSPYAISKGEAA
jgi:hypothetical protein